MLLAALVLKVLLFIRMLFESLSTGYFKSLHSEKVHIPNKFAEELDGGDVNI